MAVVIETTLGDITVDLFLEQRPTTCLNFLKLCKMKYYNYNLFHTVQSGFIAQTGDPTGEGSGGESIWGLLEGKEKRYFSGEKMPKIRHTDVGLISMVSTGDTMIGSQFFLTLGSDLNSLDGEHCVIGMVTEGHDVLRKLNDVICDENNRPYRDVRITHTVILEDPFNDPPGFQEPSRSPSPSAERLKGGRIAPDEDIDEMEGKTAAEIQEMIEEKEAKARATILEIVGDLPDADVAPPENVLFVCKLNPVTSDDDLEIIFSRFGKIVSCEVIRDKKTGDSLQYAFIEFGDKKSCEDAYFKMDNVLIDDRRIHVDFSQSVSKMRWLGKGRGVKHFTNEEVREQRNIAEGNKRPNSPERYKERSYRDSSRKEERDRYRERDNRQRRDETSYRNRNYEHRGRKRSRSGSKNRGEEKIKEKIDQEKNRNKEPRQKEQERVRARSDKYENDKKQKDSYRKDRTEIENYEKKKDSSRDTNKTEVKDTVHQKSKDYIKSRNVKDTLCSERNGEYHRSSRSCSPRARRDYIKEKDKKSTENKSKHTSKDMRKNEDGKREQHEHHKEMRNEELEKRKIKKQNDQNIEKIFTNDKSSNSKDKQPKDKKRSRDDEDIERIKRQKVEESNSKDDKQINGSTKAESSKKKKENKVSKTKRATSSSKQSKTKSKKEVRTRKRRKSSTSSDSDSSDSSSSSSSDSSSTESDYCPVRLKRKKVKESESSSSSSSLSSSSSSSSDSDSSSTSTSSSDSEEDRRRKKKKTVTKKKAQTKRK